jgi:hypothetical protein
MVRQVAYTGNAQGWPRPPAVLLRMPRVGAAIHAAGPLALQGEVGLQGESEGEHRTVVAGFAP